MRRRPFPSALYDIEAPCSKLQGIFDPQGSTVYSNRSLTLQQATGHALAPGFIEKGGEGIRKNSTDCLALLFVLTDQRDRGYAKVIVLVPQAYIASPLDLIPGLLFIG